MMRAESRSFGSMGRARVIGALLVSFVATQAIAAPTAPIEHEYVPIEASASDSDLGSVTLPGGLQAEIQTQSGLVTAPDVGRPITNTTPLYGSKTAVPDKRFSPDLDTKRPDVVQYDDPFRPTIAPFKRLVALDAVTSTYDLVVGHRSEMPIDPALETPPSEPVDRFFLDLALDLHADEPVRIPTPMAGYAIQKAHLAPAIGFQLLRDGAENLFLVPDGSGTARLAMEIAVPRAAFAGAFHATNWGDLKPGLITSLPPNVQKDVDTAAREIGIDKATMTPAEVVGAMVDYFRSFKDSDVPPTSTGNPFLDLFRSKKGVCRHRAFAMMVMARGLGIPTRFVYNEAHAWVEVHDGILWRRIDLGGASRSIDDRTEKPETPQPRHEPPADPYPWPPGATRGEDLLPPTHKTPAPAPTTAPPTPRPPTPSPTTSTPTSVPAAKVTLVVGGAAATPAEVMRSKSIAVSGTVVTSEGAPCKRVRVEVVLLQSGGSGGETMAGALVTDDSGAYDGTVTIPSDLALGDYTVTAHTPGTTTCGAASSE